MTNCQLLIAIGALGAGAATVSTGASPTQAANDASAARARIQAPAEEPPAEWIDPATGHRVIRLSREPGTSSFYFHQNGYTADGDKLVVSTREGLSTIQLGTRQIEPIVEGRVSHVVVGRKSRQVFYIKDDTVYATNVDTRATRAIVKDAELRSGSGLAVNADETMLAGSYTTSTSAGDSSGPPTRPSLEARWAARLPMALYTVEIKTGSVKKFHHSTDWLNHVQFSPADPTLLLFCHEGPWHKVDRIWTIRTDGTALRKIHTRTLEMEIAGHEFFSRDGTIIWYDLQTPKSKVFWLAGVVLATGEQIRYTLAREEWSVHFNASPNGKVFAGDGGGPASVAAPGNGQWIYLFTPGNGSLQAEKLVNLAKHDYRLEPNVSFTPDEKWIVFRSNMYGPTHVYAVEVKKTATQQPSGGPGVADLQRQFQTPPDDSRIMMRWWWFGPAVTKSELEREMRVMKEGGIGGFEVQPVYPLSLDDSATGVRNLGFLSDEFIGALRFVSEKARDLGLRMDLTVGSGWPYGGPTVSIAQAAGKLRVERVKVPAGARRVPIPNVTAGEKLIATFLTRTKGDTIAPESVREIADAGDGTVRVPADPEGPHEILFFIAGRTGMMVKRPAIGAEGFVLDHYDRGAIDSYLKNVGDRLMQAFSSSPPYAIFCDSLEVYESDWTGDFLDQFQKRRGYDLRPHLPALVIDMGPETLALRHDWGKTLTELLNDRFLAPMRDWAKRNRTRFRVQGYGVPPAVLSSNAYADLSEGEGWQWKVLRASRWASSASHLYGQGVTSSETWTWLHSPVFRATPLDLKAEADLHFLQGINQLIGHGWPYTAEGVEYPGWRFYASGAFDEKNPWWLVMPDLSSYLQRVSFMLRQGHPANDVALYLPNSDAWAHFSPGRVHMIETLRERVGPDVIAKVLEAGFNLDFVDDEALARLGHVEQGALALGSNHYRVVILPGVERIPLPTLRRLEEFAGRGGVLIATRRLPEMAPGFLAKDVEQVEVREIVRRLFQTSPAPAHFVEDENHQLGTQLAMLLRPDVSLSASGSGSAPATAIGFVHRRTETDDFYFLANTLNVKQPVNATFRVNDVTGQAGRAGLAGRRAEWWDPMSGRIAPAAVHPSGNGGLATMLELEPYESRILMFSSSTGSPGSSRSSRISRATALPLPIPPALDLSAGWSVSFGPGSSPVEMNHLESWTENETTRYYSGLATYEKDITVPENMFHDGLAVRLDFGEGQPIPASGQADRLQAWLDPPIREAAVVYVNGRRAGSIWCPPYSIDATRLLQRGHNTIRIVVGNLAINHMAGRSLPSYRLLNLRYGVRFEPQDMDKVKPVPAGLLGPIRLIPELSVNRAP